MAQIYANTKLSTLTRPSGFATLAYRSLRFSHIAPGRESSSTRIRSNGQAQRRRQATVICNTGFLPLFYRTRPGLRPSGSYKSEYIYKRHTLDHSPYFDIENTIELKSINELLDINMPKTYGLPGSDYNPEIKVTDFENFQVPYNTCGLFRGQSMKWPLIPSSYRKSDELFDLKKAPIQINYTFYKTNWQLFEFIRIAAQQNADFPDSLINQMIIGQHYGITTPLLDWTTNIFVAVYFALDLKGKESEEKNLKPYIYHIKDERILNEKIDTDNIEMFNMTSYVKPLPIDRRVERQFSAFTFHPLPNNSIKKIPLTEYIISDSLFMDLWKLMKGLGLSSFHYFPDYAGIAEKIKMDFML
jgi:hypothetical protein